MKFLLFCEMRTLQILFAKGERDFYRGVSAFNLAEFPTANGAFDFAIEILVACCRRGHGDFGDIAIRGNGDI